MPSSRTDGRALGSVDDPGNTEGGAATAAAAIPPTMATMAAAKKKKKVALTIDTGVGRRAKRAEPQAQKQVQAHQRTHQRTIHESKNVVLSIVPTQSAAAAVAAANIAQHRQPCHGRSPSLHPNRDAASSTSALEEGQEALWVDDGSTAGPPAPAATAADHPTDAEPSAAKSKKTPSLFKGLRKKVPGHKSATNTDKSVRRKRTRAVVLLPTEAAVQQAIHANTPRSIQQQAALNMVKARKLLHQALTVDGTPRLQDSEQLARVAFEHAKTARLLLSSRRPFHPPDKGSEQNEGSDNASTVGTSNMDSAMSALTNKGTQAAIEAQRIVFASPISKAQDRQQMHVHPSPSSSHNTTLAHKSNTDKASDQTVVIANCKGTNVSPNNGENSSDTIVIRWRHLISQPSVVNVSEEPTMKATAQAAADILRSADQYAGMAKRYLESILPKGLDVRNLLQSVSDNDDDHDQDTDGEDYTAFYDDNLDDDDDDELDVSTLGFNQSFEHPSTVVSHSTNTVANKANTFGSQNACPHSDLISISSLNEILDGDLLSPEAKKNSLSAQTVAKDQPEMPSVAVGLSQQQNKTLPTNAASNNTQITYSSPDAPRVDNGQAPTTDNSTIGLADATNKKKHWLSWTHSMFSPPSTTKRKEAATKGYSQEQSAQKHRQKLSHKSKVKLPLSIGRKNQASGDRLHTQSNDSSSEKRAVVIGDEADGHSCSGSNSQGQAADSLILDGDDNKYRSTNEYMEEYLKSNIGALEEREGSLLSLSKSRAVRAGRIHNRRHAKDRYAHDDGYDTDNGSECGSAASMRSLREERELSRLPTFLKAPQGVAPEILAQRSWDAIMQSENENHFVGNSSRTNAEASSPKVDDSFEEKKDESLADDGDNASLPMISKSQKPALFRGWSLLRRSGPSESHGIDEEDTGNPDTTHRKQEGRLKKKQYLYRQKKLQNLQPKSQQSQNGRRRPGKTDGMNKREAVIQLRTIENEVIDSNHVRPPSTLATANTGQQLSLRIPTPDQDTVSSDGGSGKHVDKYDIGEDNSTRDSAADTSVSERAINEVLTTTNKTQVHKASKDQKQGLFHRLTRKVKVKTDRVEDALLSGSKMAEEANWNAENAPQVLLSPDTPAVELHRGQPQTAPDDALLAGARMAEKDNYNAETAPAYYDNVTPKSGLTGVSPSHQSKFCTAASGSGNDSSVDIVNTTAGSSCSRRSSSSQAQLAKKSDEVLSIDVATASTATANSPNSDTINNNGNNGIWLVPKQCDQQKHHASTDPDGLSLSASYAPSSIVTSPTPRHTSQQRNTIDDRLHQQSVTRRLYG